MRSALLVGGLAGEVGTHQKVSALVAQMNRTCRPRCYELGAARQVASVRGGSIVPVPASERWPDAWLEGAGERIPVEVVSLYERTGEHDDVPTYPPVKGSRAAKAMALAEREVQRRTRAGTPPSLFGQVSGGAVR